MLIDQPTNSNYFHDNNNARILKNTTRILYRHNVRVIRVRWNFPNMRTSLETIGECDSISDIGMHPANNARI